MWVKKSHFQSDFQANLRISEICFIIFQIIFDFLPQVPLVFVLIFHNSDVKDKGNSQVDG